MVKGLSFLNSHFRCLINANGGESKNGTRKEGTGGSKSTTSTSTNVKRSHVNDGNGTTSSSSWDDDDDVKSHGYA